MLPAKMNETRATPTFWPTSEMANMVIQTMKAVPEASPSRPSSRLMALITATIQKTVKGMAHIPRFRVPKGSETTSIL